MLNNNDQIQLDNLKSQIPILYQRIQNFTSKINEIMHREEGDIAKQKIEKLTDQVVNYRKRIKKIEHAITLMTNTRAEREAEERKKSEAKQREKAEKERTRAEREAREKARKEKLKQEIEKKAEERVEQEIDEETKAKEVKNREQDSEYINKIEQITPKPEVYQSCAEDVEEQITFDSALDNVLFEQASSKLYDERKEVRCEGVREIERLGYKSKVVIPTLVKILQDKDGDVRVQVLESLIKLEAKKTVSKFVESLNDENVRVRLVALRGLYKLAGKSANQYFVRALRDKNIEVREHAATYLGWSCSYAAVPGLIRLKNSPNDSLRKVWIRAISGIRDRSTVPYLISILDDPIADLRRSAARILHEWTGKTFGFKENNKKSDRKRAITNWKQWWSRNKDTFQIKPQAGEVTEAVKKVKKRPKRVKKSIEGPKKDGIEKQETVREVLKKQKSRRRKTQKEKPKGIRRLDVEALIK